MSDLTEGDSLSIIVVSFNTLDMTRDCLGSIFANLPNYPTEVFVIDNNSNDGSVEMITQEFPQVILIRNDYNKGFAAANNQGFELAKGKYVLLLNSDTIVLGDVLKKSVLYLKNNPAAGAMGCRVLNTNGTVQSTCSGYPSLIRLLLLATGLDRFAVLDSYLLRSWMRDSEREVDVISGCYLMTTKKVIEKTGGLDEDFFFFGEETDWCRRMRTLGWKLMFTPVGEIVHHGGGSVKKLNFGRDIMLTEATVRLHRKYDGFLGASLAFVTLILFNCSRAIFWSLKSLVDLEARSRAYHFIQVVIRSNKTWPSK